MRSKLLMIVVGLLTVVLLMDGQIALAGSGSEQQGPVQIAQAGSQAGQLGRAGLPSEDPIVSYEKRLTVMEEWKAKIENLPSLSDKFNVGLNALQFLYTHQNAHIAEGKSQDNLSIRRSELLFYGKINEYVPKWHALAEFQSINLLNTTPGCTAGANCSTAATGTATSATFFRETYVDFRPIPSIAPNLNMFRMGVFRMPFGIFTEQSGGLRDVISSPYLTSVGSGNGNTTGAAGAMEFIHERDYFIDARGELFNKLHYVVGVMDGNNYHANTGIGGGLGANGPKQMYTRERFMLSDISFISFTGIWGESNNTSTAINGRGKGNLDRYGIDGRYTSRVLPGLMIQGELWQGHDGANATTVGVPAQGACQTTTVCGGSGAPGVQRRTWYGLAKYFISEGPLKNFEPVFMYEQFDPNTKMSNDMYTRQIVGFNYYFENLPPKIQTKLSINYEFRHHQGNGPGTAIANTDAFAQNALLVQFQVRYQ